jgi:hypothetical protein
MEAIMGFMTAAAAGATTAGTATAAAATGATTALTTAAVGAPLLSSVTGASVVGAVGAGGVLAPTAGSIFAGLTPLSFASIALPVFGSLQQAGAASQQAIAQSESLKLQARDQELLAKAEETAATQASNTIMDNMVQTIAAQRLAFAGNGVDISFGTPGAVADTTRKMGALQLSTTRQDAMTRILARRRQAGAYRIDSSNIRVSGKSEGANAVLSGVIAGAGQYATLAERAKTRG